MGKPIRMLIFIPLFCGIIIAHGFVTWDIPRHPGKTILSAKTKLIEFQDNFNAGFLDPERWKIIQEGDIQQNIIDVIAVDPIKSDEYRLRLGMNTIGTRDDTVKYIGVRSVKEFSLHALSEISFNLDWNNQSNGCYLTAAVYLCPTVTNTNPEKENDWLKLEYIGVPPGYNARAVISIKERGTVKYLYTEKWPEERIGRHIGLQEIKLILGKLWFNMLENGSLLYNIDSKEIDFESFYLYIVMSSHSNYPFREIYFDNIFIF